MCHGKTGDGKGDLVADMKLEVRDWGDPGSLEKMTDGELFWVISNGKGKMPGEGDRTKERIRWNFVNLVRSFAKKDAGGNEKPRTIELSAPGYCRSAQGKGPESGASPGPPGRNPACVILTPH